MDFSMNKKGVRFSIQKDSCRMTMRLIREKNFQNISLNAT